LLSGDKTLTKKILRESFGQIKSITVSNSQIVENTREWGKLHAKSANVSEKKPISKKPRRKIEVDPNLN
jgi:hypothetical protein